MPILMDQFCICVYQIAFSISMFAVKFVVVFNISVICHDGSIDVAGEQNYYKNERKEKARSSNKKDL